MKRNSKGRSYECICTHSYHCISTIDSIHADSFIDCLSCIANSEFDLILHVCVARWQCPTAQSDWLVSCHLLSAFSHTLFVDDTGSYYSFAHQRLFQSIHEHMEASVSWGLAAIEQHFSYVGAYIFYWLICGTFTPASFAVQAARILNRYQTDIWRSANALSPWNGSHLEWSSL